MKRLISLSFVVVFGLLSVALADTTFVASGPVSGTWTIAGNPYFVYEGDITVQDGSTLTILPGVEVLFTGNHKLIVEGLLNAEGTEEDSIIFSRAYPTEESKWRGFRFDAADEGCTLSYCLIEYAKGTGSYPGVRGGAVWIDNCSPLISNCLIAHSYTHNSNYNGAGGGICVNAYSFSVIEYNRITLNQSDSGGGILVGQECNPTIRYNLIEDNEAFYCGGGIYVSAWGQSTIHGNVIQGNSAGGFGGGGITLWNASENFSNVYNNLLVNNSASAAGGGFYVRYNGSPIYSNTIAGNQANQGGGIYVLTYSYLPPAIYNSIVWGNSAPTGSQIYLDPAAGSTATVTYCDVQGGWTGTGNINSDPIFVIGPNGDYYLSQIAAGQTANSPCVDAGNPASAMITGTTRTDEVQDAGIVDLGYHYPIEPVISMNLILTPHNPPIQIPASGGTFEFDILIENLGSSPVLCDVWTEAILPNGQPYPILLRSDVTIPAGGAIARTLTQNVPAGAPAGDYAYHACVGEHPNDVFAEDSFPFEKLSAGDTYNSGIGWSLYGWEEDYILPGAIPTEFTLHPAYPNPFNPVTTISYQLPASSMVSLSVYDLSGMLVTTLVDGWRNAGIQEVTWDASGLASGVYIYHINAGSFTASRKMVLMK